MKKLGILTLFLILSLNLATLCLAQDETKVVTTYYPSPQGNYRAITLDPHGHPPECAAVPENEGMLHYDDGTGGFPEGRGLYCCSKSGGTLDWQFLVGGGDGLWSLADIDGDGTGELYPVNLDEIPAPNWNVGIGTETPLSLLHVQDREMLVNCSEDDYRTCLGATPVSGAGTRAMFIPKKAAFRAGGVSGDQWNEENIDDCSIAANYNTAAKPYTAYPNWDSSMAFGNNSTAECAACIALGYNTYVSGLPDLGSISRGSIATGWGSKVVHGVGGVAIGISGDPNQWYADEGITIGRNNIAGEFSIAIGHEADASGWRDFAFGHNVVDASTMAFGLYPDGASCQNDAPTGNNQIKICGDLHVDDVLGVGGLGINDPGNIQVNNIHCTSSCRATSASKFNIPHPDPSRQEGTFLKHSSIESPTAGDNLYRWTVEAFDGKTTIQLPDYYKFLNKDDMVWVAPVEHFGKGYGKVDEKQKTLTIYTDSDGQYNIVLIGTRKDKKAIENWQGPEVYIEETD